MMNATTVGLAKCKVCGFEGHRLGNHLIEVHGLDLEAYLSAHPNADTMSADLAVAHAKELAKKKRTAATAPKNLTIDFGGIKFPVYTDVPEAACLPLPGSYRLPEHGALATDIQDVLVGVKANRSVWVWGPPGTGKDAVFSALCARTRRPSILLQVVQGADIQAWKYTRSFDANGTKWEEGVLLKALRDGYVTPSGERIPYLIVLSDIDRATRQQMEELRQILDSIQGRITGPTGEVYTVLPGTTIVATANSSGGGDATGRCISANPIDASILDRFQRKVQFHTMDRRDEEPILVSKFPALAAKHPGAIPAILNATKAVREAVEKDEVFCEWSHRATTAWAEAAVDLMEILGSRVSASSLLKRAVRTVLDGLPTADTRESVARLIDPHLSGGAVEEGSTAHIRPTGLKK